MTSTSFISGTGFMKCMPMTLSGRPVAAAIFVIGKRRGVRGEDRPGLDEAVERLEQLQLDVELLDRGLDHDVAAGQILEPRRSGDPREDGVLVGRGHLALVHAPLQVLRDRVEPLSGRTRR
jgi:hypothetical protein